MDQAARELASVLIRHAPAEVLRAVFAEMKAGDGQIWLSALAMDFGVVIARSATLQTQLFDELTHEEISEEGPVLLDQWLASLPAESLRSFFEATEVRRRSHVVRSCFSGARYSTPNGGRRLNLLKILAERCPRPDLITELAEANVADLKSACAIPNVEFIRYVVKNTKNLPAAFLNWVVQRDEQTVATLLDHCELHFSALCNPRVLRYADQDMAEFLYAIKARRSP